VTNVVKTIKKAHFTIDKQEKSLFEKGFFLFGCRDFPIENLVKNPLKK
jgi:hypothetical protein